MVITGITNPASSAITTMVTRTTASICLYPRSAKQESVLLAKPAFLRMGNGSTDAHIVPTLPVSGSEWLEEKEAPLKANACQEKNAGIHVEIFQIETQQAKGPLEWPVTIDIIVNPKR